MKRCWNILASGLLCLALAGGCGDTPKPEKKTSESAGTKPPSKPPTRAPLANSLASRIADMTETPSEPAPAKTTVASEKTDKTPNGGTKSEPLGEPSSPKKSVAVKEPMSADAKTTQPAAEPSKPKATVAKTTKPAGSDKTQPSADVPPTKSPAARDTTPRVAKAGPSSAGGVPEVAAPPKERHFRFEYGGALTSVPAGKRVRVWLPVPPSNDYQKVTELSRSLPARAQMAPEMKYGNQVLYFETTSSASGEVPFQIVWDVERKEVKCLRKPAKAPEPLSKEDRQRFLAADRRVPVNDPKPLALLADQKLPPDALGLARVLYDKVDDHVTYDKSKPGYGTGDVHWVCDSRFGNCTDFHSLFNSLARSKGLPSFFAIGFPLPTDSKEGEIAGYHCWAFFHVDSHGWVPVDISEANRSKAKNPKMKDYYFGNLTADRVTFTIGRDIDLVPKQAGEPLNYFIYPYAEVDGKPFPGVEYRFSFRDRESKTP